MPLELDIIIFGATGFTGKYAIEELNRVSKNYPELRWGIAGRSKSKLDKVLEEVQNKTGDDLSMIKIILADVSDADSLINMTSQAKILINCCGPYSIYGEPIIKACIETKTHQLDISGEITSMERLQLEYDEIAQNAGVYIVNSCGFASLPFDLGIIYLQQQFQGQVNSAEIFTKFNIPLKYLKFGEASTHYGPWESLLYVLPQKPLRDVRKKLFPNKWPPMLPALKSRGLLHKKKEDGWWYLQVPHFITPVTYRSQRFLFERNNERPVQIVSYFGVCYLLLAIAFIFGGIMIFCIGQFKFGRKLLLKYPRLFTFGSVSHEGPKEEMMNNLNFDIHICGEGWEETEKVFDLKPINKSMEVKVSGHDPGYGATCTSVVLSAITIWKEIDKMPGKGGVMTPGAAFAKTSLIELLNKNNLKFEVISQSKAKRD